MKTLIKYHNLSIILSILYFYPKPLSAYTDSIITIEDYTSVQTLISSHKLNASIIGSGEHQENCITFNLENVTDDTLKVLIEPGRRLTSIDTTIQDILIVKQKTLTLPPHQKDIISGYGFCCQSQKKGPKKDSKFMVGFMAPSRWQDLAKVIDANTFPTGAIQAAIWSISNGHPIASIKHENMDLVYLLRKTVAEIKGVVLPWYTLSFEKDTSLLFSNRPKRLSGTLTYSIKHNTTLTIIIRHNESDHLVTTLVKNARLGPGKYNYDLKLPVNNWQRGKYTIFVYEDFSILNLKQSFKL